MNSLQRLAITFTTLALTAVGAHATGKVFPAKTELQPFGRSVTASGYARINDEAPLSYIETYLHDPMSQIISASYWSEDKQPMAYKKLKFNPGSNVPTFYEIIDYRRAKGYRVTVADAIAKVQTVRLDSKGVESVTKVKTVAIDEQTVIDAGFHRFVIANWDELMGGKTIKVNFLQVDKARLLPLKIKKTNCFTDGPACYKISFDNFLLQSMVPNIYLEYDIPTQRLLRYNGIGPITKMNGKGMPVDIQYEYTR